ncbi:hypothetical protein AMATHDRAFT_73419 [Amanita thiersii Skay4041]|uniref:Short-chain dehydrogenase/reductase SDR n=1 Tax=Amanita thiersii Skay4041 TaxID=703135 RepID=A0A2A9NZP9_9AGAR|nr:hypothetical protein AMATHDRAFT_73419 [Amanita thiersii Skay4041]
MATPSYRRVLVVAGLGKGSGTGASTARVFAKAGYSVALVARGADAVHTLAKELNDSGGEAVAFPVKSYSNEDISSVWGDIRSRFSMPQYSIRAAVFNIGYGVWKPFLDITHEQVQESLQTNVAAAFSFSREAILDFKKNDIEQPSGARGTLIFTGATASLRGNVVTSAFAAGKFAIRGLSQSLAKEFGKQNIHVERTGPLLEKHPDWETNADIRLDPDNIAHSYLYLTNQHRSSWTWELDLRPAHEKW